MKYMSVITTEFKANFGKYLSLAATEDIYITRYGKVIAKPAQPFEDRLQAAESLIGILPDTMSLEDSMEERRDLI